MKKTNDEGFTLIELLIVIVILGILATVVVFAVGGITDRGGTSACKADLATVEVAVEAYYAQFSVYPATEAALTPGFMRDESDLYNVTASTGAITVQDTAKCSGVTP
jgi:prepilin-type N-terminal cleavage/methylation domain-containing protein